MISLHDLTAVLQRAWLESTCMREPVQFPGMTLDVTRLACWTEFWIAQAYEPPQRGHGGELMSVQIDVHCFSRHAEKRQVFEMVDRVRSCLAQQLFFISHPITSDAIPAVLRVQEGVIRDLTRESTTEPRIPLQHVVVSFTGKAEQPADS